MLISQHDNSQILSTITKLKEGNIRGLNETTQKSPMLTTQRLTPLHKNNTPFKESNALRILWIHDPYNIYW